MQNFNLLKTSVFSTLGATLNRDEISSYMLSDNNAKEELRLHVKFILCKRVKNNHVDGLKMIDYAPGFKLEEQMKYDETDEKENLKFDHLQ